VNDRNADTSKRASKNNISQTYGLLSTESHMTSDYALTECHCDLDSNAERVEVILVHLQHYIFVCNTTYSSATLHICLQHYIFVCNTTYSSATLHIRLQHYIFVCKVI